MCDSHNREATAGVNPGITATLMSRFTVTSNELVQQLFPAQTESQTNVKSTDVETDLW